MCLAISAVVPANTAPRGLGKRIPPRVRQVNRIRITVSVQTRGNLKRIRQRAGQVERRSAVNIDINTPNGLYIGIFQRNIERPVGSDRSDAFIRGSVLDNVYAAARRQREID